MKYFPQCKFKFKKQKFLYDIIGKYMNSFHIRSSTCRVVPARHDRWESFRKRRGSQTCSLLLFRQRARMRAYGISYKPTLKNQPVATAYLSPTS